MPIRVLPPETARLIAAGEVVSRPLDVVRELIDNALDAQSTRLELELTGGGLESITLRDNGCGIPADEVGLAALRHATSKLAGGQDITQVATLGFRGEALWALAQAGELTLTTRPAQQLGAVQLRAHGDKVALGKVSAAAGTTVQLRGLFAHQPARLRTQAAAASEVREVLALLSRYVLHHPQHHWRLNVDGETRLLHAPSDTRGAVASVYGPLTANRLLRLQTPLLTGVLSRPELSRPRRDRMFFAVNGRPVQAPSKLERAVIDAYAELLAAGHAPLCVLNLHLPPADINPNVHPAKSVVALAELPKLCAQVGAAVRELLAAQPLARPAPGLQPAQPSAPAMPSTFPALQLLGVYRENYLLAEGEGDLWLLDGHAAHERVLFEQLKQQCETLPALELPQPELLQLQPLQLARLHEHAAQWQAWGLVIEEFGAGLARLRSLPAALARLNVPRLHEQIVETLLADHPSPEQAVRAVLGRLACAPALKAGMFNHDNGAALIAQLACCVQPWSCPHGRPTTMRLSEREVAHAFGRRSVRDLPGVRDQANLELGLERGANIPNAKHLAAEYPEAEYLEMPTSNAEGGKQAQKV